VDVYTSGSVKYDGQPDEFYYNFGGLGGTFIYRNRTTAGVPPSPATIPFSPIAINWNYATSGNNFTTTDLAGNTYYFGNTSNSTATVLLPSQLTYFPGTVINSWYLTEIESADKTDHIFFTYAPVGTLSTLSQVSASGVLRYPVTGPATTTAAISYGGSYSQGTDMKLTEITSQNGKVDFTYGPNGLSNIAIYQKMNGTSTQIKAFKIFNSTFNLIDENAFHSNLVTPSGAARLRMDSIREVGYLNNVSTQGNPPYKFNYLSNDLPDVFSKSQDFWGLYNGKDNTDMLYVKVAPTGSGTNTTFVPAPEKRAIDTTMMKKGLLSRIVYPTGGYTDFTVEPNQIYTPITTFTTTPQSTGYHISTFYMQPNDPNTGVSVTFTVDPNITGPAKFDFTGVFQCPPGGNCIPNTPEVILKDMTANIQIADILLVNLYHNTVTTEESLNYFSLNPGHQYKAYFPTPGNKTSSSQTPQYRLDLILTEPLPAITTVVQTTPTNVYAGGLRIRQIKYNDGMGNTIIKNYNYTKPYFHSTMFRGDYSFILDNLTKDKYLPITGCPVGYTIQQCRDAGYNNVSIWAKTSTYYSEGLSMPIGNASNSSVSYQEVEEVLAGADGTTIGKNVYTYNTSQDYTDPRYAMFRVARDFIRTQLIDEKTFKANPAGTFTLVKDVVNNYNNINDALPTFPGSDSIKYYQAFMDMDYSYWLSQLPSGTLIPDASHTFGAPWLTTLGCPVYINDMRYNYHIQPFYYHVVKPVLASTITTAYVLNGLNPVSNEIDYTYANLNHLQPTSITSINSDNKIKVTNTKYPLDYNYQASCNLQTYVTSFNQQLATLKTQRDQCQETALAGDDVNNQTTHNNALAAYDQCESTYNSAVATLVSQFNANYANYQSCYASTKASLSPADKAIAFMQDRNIVAANIDVTTTVNGTQTEEVKTDYQITDNANIVRESQISTQIKANPMEARVSFAYNPSGNLSHQSKISGPPVAYQWGYNQTNPVAQVINAKSNDIFFDSFEEGNGTSALNDAKTGHYSFNGTSVAYAKALSGLDAGTYTLSYWKKTGTTWALGVNTVVAVSGSTYTINIPAGNLIDDVRFYPSAGQMTTYTYDPLIGITTITDGKGEVTYYEYDSFQRLRSVKDKDGNITKNIEYHYQR